MSILIGQKLAKKVKMENSNETFWVIFKQYALLEKRTFFVPKQSKASVESLFPHLEKKNSLQKLHF